MREAVKLLVMQRLLETRGREGTYVTKAHVPFVTRLSTDPKTGLGGGGRRRRNLPCTGARAGRADAGAGTRKSTSSSALRISRPGWDRAQTDYVVSRRQERFIEGTVWSLQTSYYPLRWTEKGRAPKLLVPQDILEGAVEYLSTAIGLKQVGYRDLISARLPNEQRRRNSLT